MIEFTASIFGAPAMQIRLEPLDAGNGYEKQYSVKIAVRDPQGDHLYQRTVTVPDNTVNVLGILLMVADTLPIEAQLCNNGYWNPRQDKNPLELM